MREMKRILAGLGLLVLAGIAAGQPGPASGPGSPPPATGEKSSGHLGVVVKTKSALEEALEAALKNNPDLRVAAAKLELAEAELTLARLQVSQKVTLAYQKVQAERAAVNLAQRKLARFQNLFKSAAIEAALVEEAEAALAKAKTSLAAAEQELKFLQNQGTSANKASSTSTLPKGLSYGPTHLGVLRLGNDGNLINETYQQVYNPRRTNVYWYTRPVPMDESSNKLRTALQKKISTVSSEGTPADLLDLVKAKSGINIHADKKAAAWKEKVSLEFKEEVTVAGLLQFIADLLPGHSILVRDYGLLIVAQEKAPERATTLEAFRRTGPGTASPKPMGAPAKPETGGPAPGGTTSPRR